MGLGQIKVRELMEIHYDAYFLFYALEPKFKHVPEWIEEVSCKS
jgi:hypothetical protein